jgi:hypothetical protein
LGFAHGQSPMGGRIQGLCFAQTKRCSEKTRVTDKVARQASFRGKVTDKVMTKHRVYNLAPIKHHDGDYKQSIILEEPLPVGIIK